MNKPIEFDVTKDMLWRFNKGKPIKPPILGFTYKIVVNDRVIKFTTKDFLQFVITGVLPRDP